MLDLEVSKIVKLLHKNSKIITLLSVLLLIEMTTLNWWWPMPGEWTKVLTRIGASKDGLPTLSNSQYNPLTTKNRNNQTIKLLKRVLTMLNKVFSRLLLRAITEAKKEWREVETIPLNNSNSLNKTTLINVLNNQLHCNYLLLFIEQFTYVHRTIYLSS